MPLDASKPNEFGLRMSVGLRRNPITDRLEVHVNLQQYDGFTEKGVTTVTEGIFPIGDDMLYDRLQEHSNNILRRLANEWEKHEKLTNTNRR